MFDYQSHPFIVYHWFSIHHIRRRQKLRQLIVMQQQEGCRLFCSLPNSLFDTVWSVATQGIVEITDEVISVILIQWEEGSSHNNELNLVHTVSQSLQLFHTVPSLLVRVVSCADGAHTCRFVPSVSLINNNQVVCSHLDMSKSELQKMVCQWYNSPSFSSNKAHKIALGIRINNAENLSRWEVVWDADWDVLKCVCIKYLCTILEIGIRSSRTVDTDVSRHGNVWTAMGLTHHSLGTHNRKQVKNHWCWLKLLIRLLTNEHLKVH